MERQKDGGKKKNRREDKRYWEWHEAQYMLI